MKIRATIFDMFWSLRWRFVGGVIVLLLGTAPKSSADWFGHFGYYTVGGTSITISDYTSNVGGSADIPSTINDLPVTRIAPYAFRLCSLTSVTIPDSVTTIGDEAFDDCSSLMNVIIGNNVTSIGAKAFNNCYALSSITIPDGVTSIGAEAFYWCYTMTNISIGNSVISIGNSAFRSCESLTSVAIPSSVTNTGDSTFRDCYALANVTIDSAVIGAEVFKDCRSITNVTFGNNVISVGDYAFWDCDALTSITIPDAVTNIEGSAFAACSALVCTTIGNSVTAIGRGAFNYCYALSSICFRGDNPRSEYLFDGSMTPIIYYRAGASGWGDTFSGRPTAIWPELTQPEATESGLVFDVIASEGQSFVVQVCTNLLSEFWISLETNTVPAGDRFEFTDSEWISDSAQFYRVVLP